MGSVRKEPGVLRSVAGRADLRGGLGLAQPEA